MPYLTNGDDNIVSPWMYTWVVWNEDDVNSAYNWVHEHMRNNPGVRIERGKDIAQQRGRPAVPSADFVLNNTSKLYSPENAGSPLFQFLLPDRRNGIYMLVGRPGGVTYDDTRFTYEEGDVYYNGYAIVPLFYGFTDEPLHEPEIEAQRMSIKSLGRMSSLRGRKVTTALYTAIRTDEALVHVLTEAGWNASEYVISIGDTTMTHWWAHEADAWTAIMQLLETEGSGASIYENGQGQLVFENRTYRTVADRSTTPQAYYIAGNAIDYPPMDSVGGDYIGPSHLPFQHYTYKQEMRGIFNDVRMSVDIRGADPTEQVIAHQGDDSLSFGVSEVQTFEFVTADPIATVTAPVVTTDYVVDSGSIASTSVVITSARTMTVTITAGGGGAVISGPGTSTTGFQVRGHLYIVLNEQVVTQTVDAGSSPRVKTLDLTEQGAWPCVSAPTAQTLVNAAAEYYRESRPTISIELTNKDWRCVEEMVSRQISDRVSIYAGPNEFQGDIWIEQINHEVTEGGLVARFGIVGSKASDFTASPGLWNSGLWDTAPWAE